MKKFSAFCLLLFSLTLQAQERKIMVPMEEDSLFKKASVLVIPFEPKLYMSQIDKQLAMRNGLNYDQLLEKMRLMLCEIVSFKVNETMKSYRLFQPDNDSIMKELHYAYTSVNYVYRPLPEAIQKDPEKKKDSSVVKLPSIVNRKREKNTTTQKEGGTKIVNGQIVSEESGVEKFMDADLLNNQLLEELSGLYHSTWFIFLNQLDLLYSSESPTQIRIKVHYTIFDVKNKKHYAGAAITLMPDHITDLKVIKDDYFFKTATEINDHFRQSVRLFYQAGK